jgi:hypothetical protein
MNNTDNTSLDLGSAYIIGICLGSIIMCIAIVILDSGPDTSSTVAAPAVVECHCIERPAQ